MDYREIELPFWQNPQFHPYLRYQRDRAIVQMRCYLEIGEIVETDSDAIGRLEFSAVKAIKFERHTRRLSSRVKTVHRSSILEFKTSAFLAKYQKSLNRNAAVRSPETLLHYVVTAHDCDINIIAEAVQMSSLSSGARDFPWLDE